MTTGSHSGSSEHWGIVVGVDGSPGSRQALRWAVANVDRFGPVRPVTTWRYPWWLVPHPFPPPGIAPPGTEFQSLTEGQVERELATMGVADHAAPVVVRGHAGPALVEAGADANLIVVGTRGHGAALDTLLGSVSNHVVSRASVPVAVIPPTADVEHRATRVVVGVDGSPGSVAALAWAIRSTPDDVAIEAVHVWYDSFGTLPPEDSVELLEVEARQRLDRAVVEATLAAGGTRHAIVHRLERGDARTVLRTDLAGEGESVADLLVVGAQGHRGVAWLLLGSTTTGLVHQPLAATVVVPAPRR